MKPTFKELEKLSNARKTEFARYILAVSFGICPKCGAKLIQKKKHSKAEYFLGIFPTCRAFDYEITICSSGKKHGRFYDNDGDGDDDEF